MDYPRRIAALRRSLADTGASLCLLVTPANQAYFSGFRTIYYPRPVLLLVEPESTTLVVPACEEYEARATANVDRVATYSEQPDAGGPASHLDCLGERLRVQAAGSCVAVEFDACPSVLTNLVSDCGFGLVDVGEHAARHRQVKDGDELARVREAAKLTEIAFAASVEAVSAGVTELEIDQAGNGAASRAAGQLEGAASLELFVITAAGVDRTTYPHTLSTTRAVEAGDVLSHSRQVGVAGYRAELERTLFVGRPSSEQARMFELVRSAQQAAIEAVGPGVSCRDVDAVAREVLAAAGVERYALHRSGHGLGLGTELPWLRYDNPSRLEEGMIVTVEPGVYLPGLGGFRHSDTLLVTSAGADVLTSFPSDLVSLTLE